MKIQAFLFLLTISSLCQAVAGVEGLRCSATAWRVFSDENKVFRDLSHQEGMLTAIESVPAKLGEKLRIPLSLSPNANEAASGLLRGRGTLTLADGLAVEVYLSAFKREAVHVIFRLVYQKAGKTVRVLGEDEEQVGASRTSLSVDISNIDVSNLYIEDSVSWYDDDRANRKHLAKRIAEGTLKEGVPTGVIVDCNVERAVAVP